MALISTSGAQNDLEGVRAQFEQWRKNRDKRVPIPESLWNAAASLHPAFSLYCISKTLRLNHTQLKNFVKQASAEPSETGTGHFIDLGVATPLCQCSAEMQHPDGKRMWVKGLNSQDLMNLVYLFWNQP
jgi:hypothetical protein